MAEQIILYKTSSARPVNKFLDDLDDITAAKVVHLFDLLQQHGRKLRRPHSRKLNNSLL